jgi:hypothetical protein
MSRAGSTAAAWSKHRRHWRTPNSKGFRSSLNFGHWCLAIDEIAISVMLHHEFAGVEPIVELGLDKLADIFDFEEGNHQINHI